MTEDVSEKDALKQDVEQQAIEPQAISADNASGGGSSNSNPNLSRRASIYLEQYQEKTTKEQVACIATYALLIASAPAIAAVVIASQYDPNHNACNDGTK